MCSGCSAAFVLSLLNEHAEFFQVLIFVLDKCLETSTGATRSDRNTELFCLHEFSDDIFHGQADIDIDIQRFIAANFAARGKYSNLT